MLKFLLFVLIFILDQWTKNLALNHLSLGQPVEVIPSLFNLTLVFNPGAAFGMFSNLPDPWRGIALGSVSFIALIVVIRFMFNEAKDDNISQLALVGILAGALGNLVDRFRFDAVVDFLDFYWSGYHWPAFNIADSAICIGVTVLMLRMVFERKPQKSEIGSV